MISLKLAGPNNETTEVIVRGESSSGNDVPGPSNVARTVTQALGSGMAHPLHLQQVGGAEVSSVPRPSLVQSRPQAAVPFPSLNRLAHHHTHPHPHPQAVVVTQTATVNPITAAIKTVPPPPPPYPNDETVSMRPPNGPQAPQPALPVTAVTAQVMNGPSYLNSGTGVVSATTVTIAPPSSVTCFTSANKLNSVTLAQTVSGNYRVSGAVAVQAGNRTAVVRAPPNVVKNSPLLVGLLQQPDQPSPPTVKSGKNTPTGTPPPSNGFPSSIPVSLALTTATVSSEVVSPVCSNNVNTTASTPISAPSGQIYSGNSFIGRGRDGVTTLQQVYSGGSVITSSVTPRVPVTGALQHHPQATGQPPPSSPTATAPRLSYPVEQRRVILSSAPQTTRSSIPLNHNQMNAPGSLNPGALGTVISTSNSSCTSTNIISQQVTTPAITSITTNHHHSNNQHHKQISMMNEQSTRTLLGTTKKVTVTAGGAICKDSQYLINPNTGLLEPRPHTDSDDETDQRPSTPATIANMTSVKESQPQLLQTSTNSSGVTSQVVVKQTLLPPPPLPPPPTSQLSQLNSGLPDEQSKKETANDNPEPESARVVNVEARVVVAQEKVKSRDSSPGSSKENNFVTTNTHETLKLRLKLPKEPTNTADQPRVPKFYIKLGSNSNQPVIVNPIDESGSSRKSFDKEDKNKRKSSRNKSRNSDEEKLKTIKLKSSKDKLSSDDVTPVLKIIDSKKSKDDDEGSLVMKIKDGERLKGARTHDNRISKSDNSKLNSKLDSKLRTRLKKSPIRKVGDLNSVGGIASHKILETLPPSITKVAALTTQHPHRNPSFSCLPSVCNSSVTNCPVTLTTSNASTQSSGELLKAQLEKRGSELYTNKSDRRTDFEKNTSDTSVNINKVRISNSGISNFMNGDIPLSDKLNSNRIRLKKSSFSSRTTCSPEVSASTSKLTIKRRGTDETRTLESFKKELPEGM